MLEHLHYDRLLHITETTQPYRGSTNRFPLWNRAHSHKYFLVEQEDGKTIFKIVYGRFKGHEKITEQEYNEALSKGENVFSHVDTNNDTAYYRYDSHHNELGIVREDNTFQFTAETWLGQGDRYFLNQMNGWYRSKGLIYSDVKLGGVVFARGEYDKDKQKWVRTSTLPIFKGLRINMTTEEIHESSKFKVLVPKMNKERMKDVMNKYQSAFDLTEVLLKTTSIDVVKGEMQEIQKEWQSTSEYSENLSFWIQDKAYLKFAVDTYMDTDMLKLFLSVGYYKNYSMMRSLMHGWGWSNESMISSLYPAIKQYIKRLIALRNNGYDMREYEPHQVYPSSWHVQILVNGKTIRAY